MADPVAMPTPRPWILALIVASTSTLPVASRCLAQEAPPAAADPDAANPEGVARTDAIEAEAALDYDFVKRETRDCIVAVVGTDADAKALATFCVTASRVARTTLPPERRAQPLDGPKIPLYSIPYGPKLEAFLTGVARPRNIDDDGLQAIRAQHACYFQEFPPFVLAERNPALKIAEKFQGSHAAHGLGHAFFTHLARIGSDTAPVWMAEGYALWMDIQIMPKCEVHCVPGIAVGGYGKRKKWDTQLGNLVRLGKDPALADIAAVQTLGDLKEAMIPKAAAVCGWLATTQSAAFWKLPHAIAALGPAEGCKAALGKTLAEVDAAWRATLADGK